jgi:ABC-2 type transport system permease protein
MGLTVGVSMIVSAVYPRFRDIAIIWTVISTALFYATPLLYPAETLIGHKLLSHLISVNPLTPIFLLARKWFIDPAAPGPASVAGGGIWLLVPAAIYVLICAFAFWVFNREAPRIAEEL